MNDISKSSSEGAQLARDKWLDLAKVVCISLLVFTNAIFWLSAARDQGIQSDNILYPFMMPLMFLGWFPLCIPAIAGSSLAKHFAQYLKNNKLQDYSVMTMVKISAFLIVLGYLLNLVTWGADHPVELNGSFVPAGQACRGSCDD